MFKELINLSYKRVVKNTYTKSFSLTTSVSNNLDNLQFSFLSFFFLESKSCIS